MRQVISQQLDGLQQLTAESCNVSEDEAEQVTTDGKLLANSARAGNEKQVVAKGSNEGMYEAATPVTNSGQHQNTMYIDLNSVKTPVRAKIATFKKYRDLHQQKALKTLTVSEANCESQNPTRQAQPNPLEESNFDIDAYFD